MSKDFKHKQRIKEVSYKTGIPKELVEKILSLQGDYINGKLKMPVIKNEDLTIEEFNEKMPVIRLHPLGYFVANFYKFNRIKNSKNERRNKTQTN